MKFSPVIFRRQRFRVLAVGLLLLTAHCALPTVAAQTPEATDTIRIDTDLVNVSVSVFSRHSSLPKSTLEQKDFAVFENGEPQEISFFASAEAPFDLVLLLDLSGSTADKIKLIRTSSKRFVDAARPGDRIAIVTFTEDVRVVSRLTLDHEALKTSIDQIAKPRGGTNFWDALRFVLKQIVGQARVEGRRSAVVVMTDGVDNALPDVFGDGSVVVMSTPGHTPGHQVLFVRTAKRGPIVLAGDLYHYPEERTTGKTPSFEFNAAQSKVSRNRIEIFLKQTGAQLWIEHDIATHANLPKSPKYVD